jgi:hypothetical protein
MWTDAVTLARSTQEMSPPSKPRKGSPNPSAYGQFRRGVHKPLLLASSQLVKGLHDLPHLMQFFRWFLELHAGSGLRR